MRLTITLEPQSTVSLPINYGYILSSLIYNNLPHNSRFVHNTGFLYEKRKFKLFTFSRLRGLYLLRNVTEITFNGKFDFIFSTAVDGIANDFAKSIIGNENVRLGDTDLKVSSVYVHKEPEFDDEILLRTISPLTIYSTLLTGEGKKKTYYFSPYEPEFSSLIDRNLRKKYFALHNEQNHGKTIEIIPMGRQKEVIAKFKETIIKGWLGIYKMRGDHELLKLAYDAGVGGKNSEGFGCFELVSEVKK
jgi:CRISPR-associated endoribonuclease Cas6